MKVFTVCFNQINIGDYFQKRPQTVEVVGSVFKTNTKYNAVD